METITKRRRRLEAVAASATAALSSQEPILFLEDIEEPEVEAVLRVLRQHGIK